MPYNSRTTPLIWAVTLILVFILLIVWQMPGTIALRNVLVGLLLILAVSLNVVSRRGLGVFIKQPATTCLLLLTGWFLLSLNWAVEPTLSLKELRGQWLVAILCGLVGGLLAMNFDKPSDLKAGKLVQVVFWALLVQVLLHDILDIAYLLATGEIPFRQAPVLYLPEIFKSLWEGQSVFGEFIGQSGDKFSYVNNTLAALVVAELIQRILLRKIWLSIGWPCLIVSLVAVVACTYFLQFRNGNVGLLLLIGFAALMVIVRKARVWSIVKLTSVVAIIAVLLASFGVALYKSDARWQTLTETVPIAWDTKTHQAWRKVAPYPELSNGQQVDASNYERLAWIKEGIVLILDHPLGTGYNRNAFGDGIDRKYEMNGLYRGGHSHSGLIDFGIANGIPGLFLWLTFLGALFYIGWAAFMRGQIAPALTLMFIVSGFLSRSIVDSNLRDHMLQQFMFLAMLFAFSLPRQKQVRDASDD